MSVEFGIGLRPHHYPQWEEYDTPRFVEVLADNYLNHVGGPALYHLRRCTEGCKVSVHSVGLNIAGQAPLDLVYLSQLRDLYALLRADIISDHLCFTGSSEMNSFDLLPFALTEETLAHVAERVQKVQDFLDRPIALENLSSYVAWSKSEMGELEFLNTLCQRTGCLALLDINNVVVSAHNLGYEPEVALAALDASHIAQFHIAGHTVTPPYLVDTHDQKVTDTTIGLLRRVLLQNPKPIILERDDEWPLRDLLSERQGILTGLLEPKRQEPWRRVADASLA